MRKIPCGVAALFAYPWYNNPASYRGYHMGRNQNVWFSLLYVISELNCIRKSNQNQSQFFRSMRCQNHILWRSQTHTHTHTNKGHYVQILFFYRKELLKGFFNMVSFHKEKDDKIQGYLFLCMRIIPGGFPGDLSAKNWGHATGYILIIFCR